MMGMIREQAAVLAYLARDVLATPPVGASGNPEYATLSADFETSVRNLLDAARSGDETRLRAAAEKLKPAYARLFLKFG
ncbi:hypothetical protein OEW28_12065 [Defluviimonas sp. WL0002]|uniref:Uncharacterized protein n=1 Tax=Albidovulum marisflavi TaxID=2984159 RepID=A0ABT2ZDZ9_9RHOB|nr:hypothetical protein [Defluviimonas sp. WL0002]MCV2869360.1 hypothetical protein [Defluviimonas sp. WL0002]